MTMCARGLVIGVALGLWGVAGCGSEKNDGPGRVDTGVVEPNLLHAIDVRAQAGRFCQIAASGNVVLVAYDGPFATNGVYLARSDDGGATFDQSKTVLVDPEGVETQSVTIAGDTIYVAYGGDKTVSSAPPSSRLARSDDGGRTFTVQTVAANTLGPAILVNGDTVYVLYLVQASGVGNLAFFQRSEDRGATWSLPVQIPVDSLRASLDKTFGLRMVSNVLEATFCDVPSEAQITAHSSDRGESWIVESDLGATATGSMVIDGDAVVLPLVDRGAALYLVESTDLGATWTRHDFQVIGGANGHSPHVDSNNRTDAGVRLAVADSTMYAIFERGRNGAYPATLGFARSHDRGASWPDADVVTAFTAHYDGQSVAEFLTEFASIAVATAPERAIVIALFDGTYLRVLRSTDDGATWP